MIQISEKLYFLVRVTSALRVQCEYIIDTDKVHRTDGSHYRIASV